MVMDESKPKTKDINCPFLKMAKPDTSSGFWKFVGDVNKAGLEYMPALLVAFDVTSKQKGIWSTLIQNQALDLYALDQVEGVSHPDKYNRYKQDTESKLKAAADADGMVTLKDLVDIKKWIAVQQEGMKLQDISKASKIETCLLFLGAGGDEDTQKAKVDNLLTFLNGIKPEAFTKEVTLGRIKKLTGAAEDMWKNDP